MREARVIIYEPEDIVEKYRGEHDILVGGGLSLVGGNNDLVRVDVFRAMKFLGYRVNHNAGPFTIYKEICEDSAREILINEEIVLKVKKPMFAPCVGGDTREIVSKLNKILLTPEALARAQEMEALAAK